ncbi:4-(cytidine 5'-diphospho)-2-C-methyl-D-erythritol kinase [Robbsia sp. KACC 23696]|uniref:4-(cytidine 5'-diphospho)-2-C-methyl-D-erythritol kinase n=1 Tax=Robbsia sp. KACC 23696 TaxID=3149231 RepID=UPI00325AC3AC
MTDCLAPAKLNLFLHITGRRPDGYHALQSVFQLVGWGDTLHFARRDDGQIRLLTPLPDVDPETDLTVRAARLLQTYRGSHYGVDIVVEKRIPMGAGLGGGSSDAATTLLALNQLWELGESRETLQGLGLKLGADVPFFVYGRNAFAEGVGELLQPVQTPEAWFLIVTPPVHASTAEIFSSPHLTRSTKAITIADFPDASSGASAAEIYGFGWNDMQAAVEKQYAMVAEARVSLSAFAPARMSGSGASVFAAFASEHAAREAQAALQAQSSSASWFSIVAPGMANHPL